MALKSVLLVAFGVAVLGLGVSARVSIEGTPKSPPPLPYLSFSTWVVVTTNALLANGSTILLNSYGEHMQVDWDAKVRCRYQTQELQPVEPQFTTNSVANFTAGWQKDKVVTDGGDSIDCTTKNISQQILQPGGSYLTAPSPVHLAKMRFLEYVVVGNAVNASLFQSVNVNGDGSSTTLQWYVSNLGSVPQIYVNQTMAPDGKTGIIITAAFQGYHELNALNEACWFPGCGVSRCVSNVNAGTQALNNAVGWACGQGNVDCANVSAGGPNYYPNTPVAHASWVFEQYFLANKQYGQTACNFNGAALMVTCTPNCTLCNASKTASPQQLDAALAWVCSAAGIQDCSPIQPGGAFFYPNTTVSHANWAFNVYFQAYQCTPGIDACDFGGAATTVSC